MSEPIVRIAARGEGVTASGRHVSLTAPGDLLHADGRIERGPHHREPPCRHFPTCGGCQLQHLDDASYSQFLSDRIAGALAAHGLVADIRAPILSPPRTRRRAVLQAQRVGKAILLGFNAAASHHVVDLAECHVLTPNLFALIAPLRLLLARLLGRSGRARVHLTECDQGVDVLIEGEAIETLDAAQAISDFADRYKLARFAIDSGFGPEVRWEPLPATITLSGLAVPLPVAAFLQATREGEAALVTAVRGAVGNAATCADLFAGLGTFAAALPGKVYAAEGARDAILALSAAARGAGRAVFTEHRDLFRRPLTADECSRFAAIVLDPPRAGAREQVQQLAASSVPVIAYVSCNPSSFARDTKALYEGGYRIDWVQPVGQFRWSTHVELAARFSRPDNPPW